MNTKNILGIIPGLQATALVNENMKMIKNFDIKKNKQIKFKKPTRRFVKTGIKNIVGIGLISPTAELINKI